MKTMKVAGLAAGGIAAVMMIAHSIEKKRRIDKDAVIVDDDIRGRILTIARNEIGEQDPAKYWSECLNVKPPYPVNWCGGFVIWVLKKAGLPPISEWEIGTRLKPTWDIQPGDIAWIDLGKSTGPTDTRGHKAIVESLSEQNGVVMVTTIDGNQESDARVSPHFVRRVTRPITKFTGFFSIDPLIQMRETLLLAT